MQFSTRTKYIIFLILCSMIVLIYILTVNFYQQNEQNSINDNNLLPLEKIRLATKLSSINNAAYVYLALGAQANQLNCESSIESLVKYGGWNGSIYMITDRANCYDKEKIIANAGMNPDNFHMIVTDEQFGNGGKSNVIFIIYLFVYIFSFMHNHYVYIITIIVTIIKSIIIIYYFHYYLSIFTCS